MALLPQGGRRDLLTRTTIRLGSGRAPLAIEPVLRALQRVPGVLTVEADPGGASALVAHDSAVPLTSLVAAASTAGAAAKVIGEPRELSSTGAAAASVPPAQRAHHPHLQAIAVAAILAVIAIDLAFPNSPEKRWIFLAPVALVWAFVVWKEVAARRR